MSLIQTLARVALGVIAYKGITNAMNRSPKGRDDGLGGLLDRISRPREGSMLDRVIQGLGQPGQSASPQTERFDDFAHRRPGRGVPYGRNAGTSPVDDLWGKLGTGDGGAAPSPWQTPAAPTEPAPGGFSDRLRQGEAGSAAAPASASEEAVAALLLRAMIQAAKSDGEIDAEERRIIMGNLAAATDAEIEFVRREMEGEVDARALAAATPPGLEREVYAASLLAINTDHFAEHDHLRRLAEALGLSPEETAEIAAAAPKRPGSSATL